MLDQKKLFKIVEQVCEHPNLYSRKKSFHELAVYLEKTGAKHCWVGEVYYHSVFTPFLNWFEEKETTQTKIESLKGFRKNFKSDEETLKSLLVLYKEFVEAI